MNPALAAIAAVIAAAAVSCSGSGDSSTAVPRRDAYPRVNLYDTAYVSAPSLPVNLAVNSSASVSVDEKSSGTHWINISYPRYNATVRLTLQSLSGDSLRRAIDNRRQRAALDIGGNTTELTELTSPAGVTSLLMLTPAAAVTPLHIIATDSARFILSGVAEFSTPDIEANAPALAAIYADLLRAAKTLSPAKP